MILRIFPVVGEALNFGARRMETIMRVAWLPVVLTLILNMVTLFAYVSVMADRLVTFEEAVPTFQALQYFGQQAATAGWEKNPQAMTIITVASLLVQLILISSFMAPLIRFAGLGERPAPGVVRVPFGADQVRFILSVAAGFLLLGAIILGPMLFVTEYTATYIAEALSQTYASFPDEESLHTIKLVTKEELVQANGGAWMYNLGAPLLIAAPVFLLLWGLLTFHFHPKNRFESTGPSNTPFRSAVMLVLGLALTALFSAYVLAAAGVEFSWNVAGFAVLSAVFLAVFYYLQLRIAPYPGVAVCRKTTALGGTLRLTRGWNILRLLLIIFFLGAFLVLVQFVINQYVLGRWVAYTITSLFQAVASYTKLISDGEQAAWVLPTFVWIWNVIKILINIFWTFFSYGVIAGLLGRLYRESERAS